MNILIKLTCLVGLVIAPILGGHSDEDMAMYSEKTIKVELTVDSEDQAKAIVTKSTVVNGEELIEEMSFEGTKEEVDSKIEAMESDLKKKGVQVETEVEILEESN
jgi:K(+)-stimulated pyrophosphate-energized sodium pump